MNSIPPFFKPEIDSEWRLLFRPERSGCYINDHSVIKGPDGLWHLIGITNDLKKANPEKERWFAHAAGSSLWGDQPWKEKGQVCDDGNRAWAPGIVRHEQRYFMLYGPSPTKLAISRDLNHWMRDDVALIGAPPEACHRDHMIIKLEESTWLLYCTGIDAAGAGVVSLFISNDLRNWRFVRYALRTGGQASITAAWGATESPFVWIYEGWYYLSITYTDCKLSNYQDTLVFRSLNPFDFGTFDADCPEKSVVQRLKAHAPEYLYDDAIGTWFITTCGWPGYDIPHEGGVSIARLRWDKSD